MTLGQARPVWTEYENRRGIAFTMSVSNTIQAPGPRKRGLRLVAIRIIAARHCSALASRL
jgi:hypothetical protein